MSRQRLHQSCFVFLKTHLKSASPGDCQPTSASDLKAARHTGVSEVISRWVIFLTTLRWHVSSFVVKAVRLGACPTKELRDACVKGLAPSSRRLVSHHLGND